jgi:type I restriction enzyme S subunit
MSIPAGWEIYALDALAYVDRESLDEKTPRDYAFYYIDIGAVSQSTITLPSVKTTFHDAPSRARKVLHSGDVLMSTVRPNLKAFAYFDQSGDDYIASTGFAVLSAMEHTDPRFILYSILSDYSSRQIDAHVCGSNYPAIKSSALRSLEVLAPPQPEQAKIAEILSTVDQAIEQTQALIAKQERIKTGLMQDLLTRGIDEHGNLRSESTHQFKNSLLGRIPVGWNPVSLESVSEFVTSGSRGWARYYSTDGAIFLRIGNLTRRHINLRLDDLVFVSPPQSSEGKRTAVETGDLLISITADLGIIAVVPSAFGEAYVNQHIALVRLRQEEVNRRFIGWFLSSRGGQRQFESLNESGAKAGLNLPTIKRLIMPKPEREEQNRIAEILDKSTEKMDGYTRRLVKLRLLKTALMQDLLTGKKRVTPLLQINADN